MSNYNDELIAKGWGMITYDKVREFRQSDLGCWLENNVFHIVLRIVFIPFRAS